MESNWIWISISQNQKKNASPPNHIKTHTEPKRRRRHYKISSARRDYRFYACGSHFYFLFSLLRIVFFTRIQYSAWRPLLIYAKTAMALFGLRLDLICKRIRRNGTAWAKQHTVYYIHSQRGLCDERRKKRLLSVQSVLNQHFTELIFLFFFYFFVEFFPGLRVQYLKRRQPFNSRKISWDSKHLSGFFNVTTNKPITLYCVTARARMSYHKHRNSKWSDHNMYA